MSGHNTPPVRPAQADLFAAVPCTGATMLGSVQAWREAGWLRRIDAALAAFVLELDPHASAATVVATALLAHMEGRGHTCLPLHKLLSPPVDWLAWPAPAPEALAQAWSGLPSTLVGWRAALHQQRVVDDQPCLTQDPDGPDAPDGRVQAPPLVLGGTPTEPMLYLRRYWGFENAVARQVLARAQPLAAVPPAIVRTWLDRLFDVPADGRTDWQKLACAIALRSRFTVITGGPGTGKTYTAARLLALLFATSPDPDRLRVGLAAPTGKAAARLKQSIDAALSTLSARVGESLDLGGLTQRIGAARTLHSLLGARPDTRHMRFHAGHVLDVDVLIVDEASMVHLEMMAALLDALPPTASLVLLGDKDQLASVEAGAVLGDLCREAAAGQYSQDTADYVQAVCGQALTAPWLADPAPWLAQHTVMLRESRRFGGPIGLLAQAVNAGDVQAARAVFAQDRSGAVHAETAPQPATVWRLAVHGRPTPAGQQPGYDAYLRALRQRPEPAGPSPQAEADHHAWVTSVLVAFERCRVLCAVREGEWGTLGLNRAIERALAEAGWLKPRGEWYLGRPVMVTRNDAGLGVFNGDIGITLPASQAGSGLRVYFLDGEALRSVAVSRLAHVETAFAMTVHKSQGSEFEHTILVLPPYGASLVQRELVYTGITRARQGLTLVSAQADLLDQAMLQPTQRASGLLALLQAPPATAG